MSTRRKGWRTPQVDPTAVWRALSTRRFLLLAVLAPAGAAVVLEAIDVKCPISFAGSFAPNLWVVEAAILGFAVAVVVYAYQALGRESGLPDDLAVASSFPATVNVGLASIFLLGVSLIAEWDGAAWLTLFAVALSCVWFVVLTQGFRDATRAASPGFRVGIRQRRLLSLAASLARQQARDNVAGAMLDEALVKSAASNSPWLFLGSDDQEDQIFRAPREGRLTDVDLVRLRQVIDDCKKAGLGIKLALRFDRSIATGTPLARANGPIPRHVGGLLTQCLVIKREKPSESLAVEVIRLRDEALLAMGPTTAILDEVLLAYERVLNAFAASWHEYVDELTAEYVEDLFTLDTPVQAISRSLFDLMERALAMDARDSALNLAYYPVRILRQAVALRAPAFAKFLDLYVSYYATTSRTPTRTDISELVRDRCWRHMIEAMNYILPTAAATAPRHAPAANYAAGLAAITPRLVSVMKLMVDATDKVNFEEGLRSWRQAEAHERREWVESAGDPEAPLVPVALAWVIARRYQRGVLADPRWWLERVMGDATAQQVVTAIDRQLETGVVDIGQWAMMELPSGEAHFIDTDSDLLRSLAYMLLLVASHSGEAPSFEIGLGLYARREHLAEVLLECLAASATIEADLRISDVTGRLTAIREAFDESVKRRERADRDAIRVASIEPRTSVDFAAAVLKERDNGFPRWILEASGSVHRMGGSFADLPKFGLASFEDKKLVVSAGGLEPNGPFFGESYGRSLARGELQALLASLEKLPPRDWRLPTATGRLTKAVDRLREAGVQPNLILIPVSWRLLQTLEREGHFTPSYRKDVRDVAGSFDGIRVCDCLMAREDSAYVLNLPAAVTLKQYIVDGQELESEIRSLRDDEIQSLSEERLSSVAPDQSEDRAARAALIVRFDAWERIAIAVDREAAIRVRLPKFEQ